MIAGELGVSRRTLFGYYPSKNDIPWGQFDRSLADFERALESSPANEPLWRSIDRAVQSFNDFPENADPPHAERMRLILGAPALQAHSVLRYAAWRSKIAAFVGQRTGRPATDPLPVLVGHVSLALALAAYEQWLEADHEPLPQLLGLQMAMLRDFLAPES